LSRVQEGSKRGTVEVKYYLVYRNLLDNLSGPDLATQRYAFRALSKFAVSWFFVCKKLKHGECIFGVDVYEWS
jgi:hypothetical protein